MLKILFFKNSLQCIELGISHICHLSDYDVNHAMSHSVVAQSVDTGNCRWTWLHLLSPSGFEIRFGVFLFLFPISFGKLFVVIMFLYYILQCATVVVLVSNKISLNTQEDLQALRSWLGKCPHLKGARQGVRLNISKRF